MAEGELDEASKLIKVLIKDVEEYFEYNDANELMVDPLVILCSL